MRKKSRGDRGDCSAVFMGERKERGKKGRCEKNKLVKINT
jgi:hypothetical protein